MIFSKKIMENIYKEAQSLLNNCVMINMSDLEEEVDVFEATMAKINQHPWQQIETENVIRDTSSALYQKIQTSYVGDDPEEDYKEVLVWKIAEMLFVTIAVDHDPNIEAKWSVVVFNDL